MHPILSGLGLLFVAMTVLAGKSLARSRARNPMADQILEDSAAVFTGAAQRSVPAGAGQSVTTFTVTEPFKGVTVGTAVGVLHPDGPSASCGVRFAPGDTYTLSASRVDADPGLAASLYSTWMFMPQVPISANLIRRMRALAGANQAR
jgi:hypothetical protein